MTAQQGALCAGHRLDFTELTDASPEPALQEARATCAACPLLVPCRRYALKTTVAGVAGGLTETERDQWRKRQRVQAESVSIVDVTPGREITPTITDALPDPDPDGAIPPEVVDLVMRMTREGIPAEEIVTRLHRPDVTHRTVKYIRHRYSRGPTRVDA
jgi:hypothetical protein